MFYRGNPEYIVNFKPITVSKLAMDAASAGKFVASLRFARSGMRRAVQLIVGLEIVQNPMKLSLGGSRRTPSSRQLQRHRIEDHRHRR